MNYPLERISLQQANHLVFELMELGLSVEFETGDYSTQVEMLLAELYRFGVGASTVVKTNDYSPGSTSVLQYVRINMHTIHISMDSALADWVATYSTTGFDSVNSLIAGKLAAQGC